LRKRQKRILLELAVIYRGLKNIVNIFSRKKYTCLAMVKTDMQSFIMDQMLKKRTCRNKRARYFFQKNLRRNTWRFIEIENKY